MNHRTANDMQQFSALDNAAEHAADMAAAVETGEGKAYVTWTCYRRGDVYGAGGSGFVEPRGANQLITAISNVLEDTPDDWADRIVVVVS